VEGAKRASVLGGPLGIDTTASVAGANVAGATVAGGCLTGDGATVRVSSKLGGFARAIGFASGDGGGRASAEAESIGNGNAAAGPCRPRRARGLVAGACRTSILVASTGEGRRTPFAATTVPAPIALTATHFHTAQRPSVVAVDRPPIADATLVLAAAAVAAARIARCRAPFGGRSSLAEERSFALSPPPPM
jgi:hypothetical protein